VDFVNLEHTRRFAGRLDWIELVLGYGCNCRCQVCPSVRIPGQEHLETAQVHQWISSGHDLGASGVWFGGGEPSLQPALAAYVEQARRLGYQRIRVQTNGLRFAYPAYARRLVDAGMNEVCLSVKGADAATHDGLTRIPGGFALLERAAENLAGMGVRLGADVLMTTRSLDQLTAVVERFGSLGCVELTFWLVSLHGLDAVADRAWLPRFDSLAPHLQAALERADQLGLVGRSLHTPPCVLPASVRDRYHPAGRYRLLVVTPGQAPFLAEDSPMEGGQFLPGCAACSARGVCLGLRADYLDIHGSAGIAPLG
jgi:MoaA/NifB/PqqE/SkfB family radical SAM enzyme